MVTLVVLKQIVETFDFYLCSLIHTCIYASLFMCYYIPSDVRIARERRIQRAFDLSTKQKELPEELQPKDPFESYLGPYLNQSNRDVLERSVKNSY